MPNNSKKNEAYLKEREQGFDLRFCCPRQVPEYNALRDENMRNYFESTLVQHHLMETGQVDHFGTIISLEKHRSRLRIIENEIERAERTNQLLEKDEADTRHLVQKERFRDIDKKRRLENVERRKTEMKTQMDLVLVEREVLGYSDLYAGNHRRMIEGNQQKRSSQDHLH